MKHIQATEAKAKLASLLRLVEAGESVVITRHGKAIAHIVPADAQLEADRSARVERFRALQKQWAKANITAEEAMNWRHEGHRF